MSESQEVQMIVISKQYADLIIENLNTAVRRNMLSRTEQVAAQNAAQKFSKTEDDDEITTEKQALRDLLELLEHCLQRNPPYSRWVLENINIVLNEYKDHI